MPTIKKIKPTTSGRRHLVQLNYSESITKTTPEKSLLITLKRNAGRNNRGVITCQHKQGGHKKRYRVIDFKRNKDNVLARVHSIEYDPYRNANIALLHYVDGEKRYILAPKNLNVDDQVISGDEVPVAIGNCMQLKNIPEGLKVHNIEMRPFKGGQIARSAGTYAQILGLSDDKRYVLLRLKSTEVRKILATCRATIGSVGNENYNLISLGKAGKNVYLGKRSTVRGSAKNPNDHPHGGGEGKAPVGRKGPATPWGKYTLGLKTRRKNKKSSMYIVTQRKNKNKK